MIRCNHVKGTVLDALDQSRPVSFRPQRRIHFIARIQRIHILGCQSEMMGRHLRCHTDSVLFPHPHQQHGGLCGAMAKMQLTARISRQHDVSCDDHIFHAVHDPRQTKKVHAFVRIDDAAPDDIDVFAMCQNGDIQIPCDLHGLLINAGIHDGLAVLTDRRRACPDHSFDIGQFFSVHAFCDSTYLQHIDDGTFSLMMDIVHHVRIVHDGNGVRHGKDRRKSAFRRCPRAGKDVLFFRLTGIAHVLMQIDQARHHKISLGLDGAVRFLRDLFRVFLNPAVIIDEEISDLIRPVDRIQDSSLFDQDGHFSSPLSRL